MHSIARCCQPVPGDDIEGYITQGRGISVHRKQCVQLGDLREVHPERIIDATWGNKQCSGYALTIRLEALDRNGLLKDITTFLSNEKVKMLSMNSTSNFKHRIVVIDLNIEVQNNEDINKLINQLNLLQDVTGVRRL